jgi:hypothetical protein
MKAWRRRGEYVIANLEWQEADLLRGLIGQVTDMLATRTAEAPQDELAALTGMRTGPATAPDDPILARLLPDFHRLDDEDASPADEDSAAGMRSLHEPALIDYKNGVAAVVLRTCPADGGDVKLDDEEAAAWLAALNDVRLALGTALNVTEDTPDQLSEDDPRSHHLGVYQWLSFVQDTLIDAVQQA